MSRCRMQLRGYHDEFRATDGDALAAEQCCGRVNAVSSALEPFLKDPRRQIGA